MFAEVTVVFLLDVDNTLIDHDRARDELTHATERILGVSLARAYWERYEAVRSEVGYVDTLETLERFHAAHPEADGTDLDRALLDFPYDQVRYPQTLDVLAALARVGTAVVFSDGDPVFQPLKIHRAGVADAVGGNVLVFTHKDERLADVARLYPADRYVVVDDKAAILARIKQQWRGLVRTVHVLQGKYADDPFEGPPPDVVIAGIGELRGLVGTPEALRVFLEGASIRGGG